MLKINEDVKCEAMDPKDILEQLDNRTVVFDNYLKLWEYTIFLLERLRHSEQKRFENAEYKGWK